MMISAAPAYAYIDFGTGSYVFQVTIASFLAAGFFLKNFWTKIINFFKSKDDDSNK